MKNVNTHADMHFHTNYSDGRLCNHEIIKKVKKSGGLFVATDHDYVNEDFPKIAKDNGLLSMPGVEISILDASHGYFHITAYAKEFKGEIMDVLENTRNGRRKKIYEQIRLLKKNGIRIDEESFFGFFEKKGINVFNLNIYHLASYIYRSSHNIEFIRNITGVEMGKIEFLKRCLRDEGDFSHIGAVTIPEYTPDIKDVIRLVKENAGITSIAHPNFSFRPEEYRQKILYFLGLGMDAIEINSKATGEQIDIAKDCLGKDNMLTFGSDCHFTPYSEADHGDFTELNPNLDDETICQNIREINFRLGIR